VRKSGLTASRKKATLLGKGSGGQEEEEVKLNHLKVVFRGTISGIPYIRKGGPSSLERKTRVWGRSCCNKSGVSSP